MPCEAVKLDDGRAILMCSRGQRRRKCHCCGAPATRLCDFIPPRAKKSCDKPLCDRCAVTVEDFDYCPDHPQLSLVL